VLAGTPYIVNGNDFSTVGFPQDLGNCTKCHDPALAADANNYKNVPTQTACGACHDLTWFGAVGSIPAGWTAHPGGPMTDDSACNACHAAGSPLGADVIHFVPGVAASAKFAYTVVSVTNTTAGSMPSVTFKVTDPTNANAAYNILTDPAFANLNDPATGKPDGANALSVVIGYSTADLQNAGTGSNPGQPIRINALSNPTNNNDGTFTVTSTVAIPATATGSGLVSLQGHPADTTTSPPRARVPVQDAIMYFAITDAKVTARRTVVDINKCNVCHGLGTNIAAGLSVHGNNRTGRIESCVTCHNSNATDINRRPTTGVGIDGLAEQAIDFKVMIHGIHGADYRSSIGATGIVVYGFGGTANDFRDVGFPGIISNCEACHVAGSYGPISLPIGATTISTSGNAADPTGFLRVTKNAAVCSSCHASTLFMDHMQQNGGQWGLTQAQIDALP
jgi:OmcA/MtrC family decaheme c-type cytochrome